MDIEHVILVDPSDNNIGTMEKLEAHKKGLLHRAFSIFLFNSEGQLLLQKRSSRKYHSAGLWTNTCCSHPRPGESMANATKRKLAQELGIDVELKFAFKFTYEASLDNELTEHELDHVYVGQFDGIPQVNPDEVEAWRFISKDALDAELDQEPERFTYWFKQILMERKNIFDL